MFIFSHIDIFDHFDDDYSEAICMVYRMYEFNADKWLLNQYISPPELGPVL